jgi:hypothetical protein
MEYHWERSNGGGRTLQLIQTDPDKDIDSWARAFVVGRLCKVKNKRTCKKFVVYKLNERHIWEYVALLNMKLAEAKEVAKVLILSGVQQ